MSQSRIKELSAREISAFCAQISLILKAGITVAEGVEIMRGDDAEADREVLGAISEPLSRGVSFAGALRESGCFPDYVLDMTEIGETTGRLDRVMDGLCDYYEQSDNTAQSIRSAVSYPLVMVVLMLLTVFVLVKKVLPIFARVFDQLGAGVSASGDLLRFGYGLGRGVLVVLLVVVALAVILLLMRATPAGKRALDRLFDRLPLTAGVSQRMSAGKFASAMALMLSSGLEMDRSMELAAHLVSNDRVSAKIDECKKLMTAGTSFAKALEQTGLFTGINARMVAVGAKSGSVDTVMQRVAERYHYEVSQKLSGLVAVLEPTLVALLSVVVGVILISVMLPLMGIMSGIG